MKSENKYGRKGAINMGKVEGDAKATNLAVAKRRLRYLVSVAVVCALLSVPVMADGGGDMGEYPIPYDYDCPSMLKADFHFEEEKAMGDGYYRRAVDYEGDSLSPHVAQMIEHICKQGGENPQEGTLEAVAVAETKNCSTNIVAIIFAIGIGVVLVILAVGWVVSSVISSIRGNEVSNEANVTMTGASFKTHMRRDSKNPNKADTNVRTEKFEEEE